MIDHCTSTRLVGLGWLILTIAATKSILDWIWIFSTFAYNKLPQYLMT